MKDLAYYLDAASRNGPPRPGIILAIRMCIVALTRLDIHDPLRPKRRLIVIVETDRCLPDAAQLVTGCRLGNRTLKLQDTGKMAAVFIDLQNDRAVRLAALESANRKAAELFPALEKADALSRAYKALTDRELFSEQRVRVPLAPEDLPGYHAPRVICSRCGEGIAFRRETQENGRIFCRTCAAGGYYKAL
ncbi:MAG TPA: FmdE family protein [Candidatus Angelobacter sp.]|nr:FmdE family protein [Candidatus Angelobacter sp.]